MSDDNDADKPLTLVDHLIELRQRLIRIVLAVGVLLVILFPFARELYELLAFPLMSQLPNGDTMLATDVISNFLTPLKFTLVLALAIAAPYWLYQVWAFVAPGLYMKEKKLVRPLIVSSILLFYLGIAFAYFVVIPLIVGFSVKIAPDNVAFMPDISKYLDFVLKLFVAFGLSFEIPIATILLTTTGMVTVEALSKMRPYVFLGAFVAGMLLTPPDLISQVLLALPMWLLFECGLFCSKLLANKAQTEENSIGPETE